MQLKIDYKADTKGYELIAELDANAEKDAEALGYAVMVLFEAAKFLSDYAKTLPEDRVKLGVGKALSELQQNPNWPFDITVTFD